MKIEIKCEACQKTLATITKREQMSPEQISELRDMYRCECNESQIEGVIL